MARRKGDRDKKCKTCLTPIGRVGTCERCKELRRLITEILDDPDDLGHKAPKARAKDIARRVELHRNRAALFRDLDDPRFTR